MADRLIARRDALQDEINALQEELASAKSSVSDIEATETQVGKMSAQVAELEQALAEEKENAASIAEILKVVRDKEQRAEAALGVAESKRDELDAENDGNRRGRRRAEQAAQQLADVLEEIGRNEAAQDPAAATVAPLADLVAQLSGLLSEVAADDDGQSLSAERDDFYPEVAETAEVVARTIGTRYQQVCRALGEVVEDRDQAQQQLAQHSETETANSGAMAERDLEVKKLRGRLDTAHQDNEDLANELAQTKSSLTRAREDLSDAKFEREEARTATCTTRQKPCQRRRQKPNNWQGFVKN